ncbi:MAG: ferritin family protein [Candidatus Methanomethylicia archaeon]
MSTELILRLKDAVMMERENASKLKSETSKISNTMVKVLMGSIAHDSRKHSELFKALWEMIKGLSKPLNEEEYENLNTIIAEHINVELKMMEVIEGFLKSIEDERLKYVLRYILDDEKRHHKLLLGLQEAINRRELVTEFNWLDIVWRDVPFFF